MFSFRTAGIAAAVVAAMAVLPMTASADAGPARAPDRAPTTYYLSLGDSLAQGYQPGLGNTDAGYADDVYARLSRRQPSLRLVKLGCTGETTGTMIAGQHCAYPGFASQLDAAVSFLRAHRGHVALVTIDIGGNDVDNCALPTGIAPACVTAGLRSVVTDLPVILGRLRAAGGDRPDYVGVNTYDPFLAAWLTGQAGQAEASYSVTLAEQFNTLEAADYRQHGFRVADVAKAFDTEDFTTTVALPPFGTVPANVAEVCGLTYMCTQGNIHPNPTGYRTIAATVLATVRHHRR